MATLPAHIEAASTLAIIASSNEPLLFLDNELRLIAASASFCRTFQIDPAGIQGKMLAELGGGEWALPQIASLLKATVSGSAAIDAYEIDIIHPGRNPRHLLLNAHRLEDGDAEHIRVLLAINDVTQARTAAKEKDDLLREKSILLREIQHRVANSLQIIASVLMQSAMKVQSEEARGHLHNAHHRVMSIAMLQRQLAASTLGEVPLRAYFTQLCDSLGASMIQDPTRLAMTVTVDDSVVKADSSVSLGLIVTELVINALKHAFPARRHGRITVDYRSDGAKWSLSVRDDGIGRPKDPKDSKPGLGSGIVEALANQLGGTIDIVDGAPGTLVSIVHDEVLTIGNVPASAQHSAELVAGTNPR